MPETTTIEQQIAELRRERAMRRTVYPRLITQGRMTEADAIERCERLDAAIKTLEGMRTERDAKVNPGLF